MKTLLVILTALAVCAVPVVGEPFLCQRDNANDQAGGPPPPGEWHSNEGANNVARIKASDHQWYGDWDMGAILEYMDCNPCPQGMYYEARLYVVPDAGEGGWVPGAMNPVQIAAVWSENDWVEGDAGRTYSNYNWTNPTENFAATEAYAGDTEDPNNPGNSDPVRAVPWVHPTRGVCTMMGTFLDYSDKSGTLPDPLTPWQPWLGVCNSVRNSQDLMIDPDQTGVYHSVVLDAALFQDMLTNPNNRGLALYNLPPDSFANRNIRTREYVDSEPYLDVVCVPEPATLLLLVSGGLLMIRRKR